MAESENPATTVTFDVAKEQVWIEPDGTAWYVRSVSAFDTVLERTVVKTMPTRDLVRVCRQMNDKHPLHGAGVSPRTDQTPEEGTR